MIINRVPILQYNQQNQHFSNNLEIQKTQPFTSYPSSDTDDSTVCSCDDSTVSSISSSQQEQEQEQEQKSVHFDMKVSEKVIQKVTFKAREVWYSSSDLRTFRANAQQEGSDIQEKHHDMNNNLKVAFSICPTFKKQQALNSWASHDDSYRGLEAYANTNYSDERCQVQEMLWAAVMEAQSSNASSEDIRNICQQYSRPAKSTAHIMGKADAKACGNSSKKSVIKRKTQTKYSFGNSRK